MYKKRYMMKHGGIPGVPKYFGKKSYEIMNTLDRDMGIFTETHNHIRSGMHRHGIHRHR